MSNMAVPQIFILTDCVLLSLEIRFFGTFCGQKVQFGTIIASIRRKTRLFLPLSGLLIFSANNYANIFVSVAINVSKEAPYEIGAWLRFSVFCGNFT